VGIGLLAGSGALALGGIGCLVGDWSTAAQASRVDLTLVQGTGLIDRSHALNTAGIALTITGSVLLVVDGAVTWAVAGCRVLNR
jgi:hypothetical protein